MITFPNAKINLGLHIVEKRPDGFHNIETCFYPVNWCDIIEINESKKTTFRSTGIAIPGNSNDNLCLKAFKLLQKDYQLPNVEIHLHKNIPIGAGLGGGSADAAFVIKAIAQKYDLIFENDLLKFYASQIGSDCAFFIDNQPSIAFEKGDVLSPIDLDLKGKYLVLVYPEIHIDTKTAYSGVNPRKPEQSIEQIVTNSPINEWKNFLVNDFEKGIFQKFPELEKIKSRLYDSGAMYAAMSGSGSTIFGIFDEEVDLKNSLPKNYRIWSEYLGHA